MTPPWWKGAAIYQIYPRSFADGTGDGVGDFAGMTEKLVHVARLGVDGVWLSPFFRSPMKDFGYDVADYCDVDPVFGTLAEFDTFLVHAHDLGLKVIIDQVYSHTSDQHAWFKDSRRSRTGDKADWYVWADAKPDGSPPNNWLSVFGGPAWSWDATRRQYYLHNFLTEQPDLNFHNPAVQEAVLDVARFWLDRGVDGFRLDVANYFFHDADLRDNPPSGAGRPARPYDHQIHRFNRSQAETLGFIERQRGVLDAYEGRMAVAEIFSAHHNQRSLDYTLGERRLHTAYNFLFLNAPELTPDLVRSAMSAWEGVDAWPSWSFSNHDVARAVSRWGGDAPPPAFAKMLVALLGSLRGTAFIYQGEELGLPQANVPFERLRDPEAIRFWPETLGRDGARTPMPWTADAPNAGFSPHAPWLPVDPRHHALAVDAQTGDPNSVLAAATRFFAFRTTSPALRTGGVTFLETEGRLLVFERAAEDERLVCGFNLSNESATLSLDRLSGATLAEIGLKASLSGRVATLPPYGGFIARPA